jgi:hypothetical protein
MGAQGMPGISGHERVTAESSSNGTSPKEVVATCPIGTYPLGGGAAISKNVGDVALLVSEPLASPQGWHAVAAEVNPISSHWRLTAFVICARVNG